MKIDVLGTKYTVQILPRNKEPILVSADGFCDKSSKRIVVCNMVDGCDFDDKERYLREVMRHEIVHAFLNESGLSGNWEHKPYGHEETLVDWIAIQYPKIKKAFEQAGCES